MLPKLKLKIKKNIEINDDNALLEKLKQELTTHVNNMYKNYPYSFIVNSSRIKLRKKEHKIHINKISNENKVFSFGSKIGDIKFALVDPFPSVSNIYVEQALEKLYDKIGKVNYERQCIFDNSKPYIEMITRTMKYSSGMTDKIEKITQEILNETNELFEKTDDKIVIYCTMLLYNIYRCIQHHQEYLDAYNNAKKTFWKMYEKFHIKDYKCDGVSFYILPLHSIKMTTFQYTKIILESYDYEHTTTYQMDFITYVNDISFEDRKDKIIYYQLKSCIDDIDYANSNNEE